MNASALFDAFVSASTFRTIQHSFLQLCLALEIDSSNGKSIYRGLRQLNDWKAEKLWKLLDKRINQKEYLQQKAGDKLTTLIIGAGPCGLRMAIECALLGNRVILVEQRDKFSRNNVLHLWEFVIHDIKALGAKIFYPKFCTGSIEHISIRQLQCILLKVALCFGVQVHEGVSFKEIVFPSTESTTGFRAIFEPSGHILSKMDFDILIGADGKRNTVPGFRRDELRGKLAIAITANFINKRTPAEENVPEISGVAYIFNQAFFKNMYETTGVDLENIVYYKDETHYFVMCAKKHSLLDMGVLRKDCDDAVTLLSSKNLDKEALCAYAVKAANFATGGALPSLEFAENHRGDKDIAAFDFTSLYSAKHSVRLVEGNGKRLLVGIVGDSLHEPFWPTGSGCARGFLGVFDTAWLIRDYGLNIRGPLEMIAERESVFRLLTQVTKDNMHKMINKYTIDPRTRYMHPDLSLEPDEVVSLVYSDNPRSLPVSEPLPLNNQISAHSLDIPSIPNYSLWKFCCHALMNYKIKVTDLDESWNDGLALGGLIAKFASKSLDYFQLLTCSNVLERLEICFGAAESSFNVDKPCSPSSWIHFSKIEYLAKIVSVIRQNIRVVQQCLITPRSFKKKTLEKPRPRAARRATQPIEKLAFDLLESFKGDEGKNNRANDSIRRLERLKRQESDPSAKCAENKFPDRKNSPEAFQFEGCIMKDKKLHFNGEKQKEEPAKLITDSVNGINNTKEPFGLVETLPTLRRARQDTSCYDKENGLKNHSSIQLKRHSDPVMGLDSQNIQKQTFCDFCGKVVYLTERIQVEAAFIHKNCFRCSICSQMLRLGEYGKDKELDHIYPRKLFCKVHLRISLKEKISQLERVNRKRLSVTVLPMAPVPKCGAAGDNPITCFHPTLSTPQHFKESRSIISPISELTSEDLRTPERAEFGTHIKTPLEHPRFDVSESEEDEQLIDQNTINRKTDSDEEPCMSECENFEEADFDVFQKSVLQLDDENPENPVTDEQLVSIIDRMNQRRRSLLPDGTPPKVASCDRILPYLLPSTKSFEDITRDESESIISESPSSGDIRKQKNEELEKFKYEMRLKARMKSDDELGIKSKISNNQYIIPKSANELSMYETPAVDIRQSRSESLVGQMPSISRLSLTVQSNEPSLMKEIENSERKELLSTDCSSESGLENIILESVKEKKSVFQSDDLHIESRKETGMLGSPYHLFKKKEKKKREASSPTQPLADFMDAGQVTEPSRVATVPPLPRKNKVSGDNEEAIFVDIPSDEVTLKQLHKKAEEIKRRRGPDLNQSAGDLHLTIERNNVRLLELRRKINRKVEILEIDPNDQKELILWLELIKERDSLELTNEGKKLELERVKLHHRYRELNKKLKQTLDSKKLADRQTLSEMLQAVNEKTEVEAQLKNYLRKSVKSLPRIEDVLRHKEFCYRNFGPNYKFTAVP